MIIQCKSFYVDEDIYYRDVAIEGERLQNLCLCWAPRHLEGHFYQAQCT